ncbi:hypothetical protein FWK35_00027958 [Aphis craccivora]|uniref:Uncharacterized protein n=1 Tax=Aphis craccivora TaxID=307492 RepID=A0A6G0YI80_APHCR|nr:hypothetical protein FWK35_00027958 [Aphis craccivora]
MHYHLNIRPTP